MIVLPLVILKCYEQYDLEIMDRVQIWLITDGLVLVIQAIINGFLKTIPVYPDMPMPPLPKGEQDGKEK